MLLKSVYIYRMKKVPIHARVDQTVKDMIDQQAKDESKTPSKHIGDILTKHVSKKESQIHQSKNEVK